MLSTITPINVSCFNFLTDQEDYRYQANLNDFIVTKLKKLLVPLSLIIVIKFSLLMVLLSFAIITKPPIILLISIIATN